MVMFTQRFYIAMILIVVAVLIVAFLIYSFFRKPKSNDFDPIEQKSLVDKPVSKKNIAKGDVSVKKNVSVRRLMPS